MKMKNYKYLVQIWDREFNVPFASWMFMSRDEVDDYIQRELSCDRDMLEVQVYEMNLILHETYAPNALAKESEAK